MSSTTAAATEALTDPLLMRLFSAALLRGTFTLRSGATSDRYFDKYRVTCDPCLLAPVADRLTQQLQQVAPDGARIIAPALGAVPLATAVSLQACLPIAIVRDAAKQYGTAHRIEGVTRAGEEAVLIEDVVTSGGAVLEALAAARDAGVVIRHALCVLDRDGGGREALAAAGVTLTALASATDLTAAFDAGIGMEQEGEQG